MDNQNQNNSLIDWIKSHKLLFVAAIILTAAVIYGIYVYAKDTAPEPVTAGDTAGGSGKKTIQDIQQGRKEKVFLKGNKTIEGKLTGKFAAKLTG